MQTSFCNQILLNNHIKLNWLTSERSIKPKLNFWDCCSFNIQHSTLAISSSVVSNPIQNLSTVVVTERSSLPRCFSATRITCFCSYRHVQLNVLLSDSDHLSVCRRTQAPFWWRWTPTSCCPSTPLTTCTCTQTAGWVSCRRTSSPSQTPAFSTCGATGRTSAVSSGVLWTHNETQYLF